MTEPAARSKRLAQAAFAVSLVFVCFFPLCAVGGVLAVVDWFKERGQPQRPGFDFGGWAIRLNALSLAVSICLVPSMPMFLTTQQKSKQRECRDILHALHERAAGLKDGGVGDGGFPLRELADTVPQARFQPYAYVLSPEVVVPAPAKKAPDADEAKRQLALTAEYAQAGVRGECPACDVTIACVGNFDGDEKVDLLSVSTAPRWSLGILRVEPGEVMVHLTEFPGSDKTHATFAAPDAGP